MNSGVEGESSEMNDYEISKGLMDNFATCFFVQRDRYWPPEDLDKTFDELIEPGTKFSPLMRRTKVRDFLKLLDDFMSQQGLTMEEVLRKSRVHRIDDVREANLYLYPVFKEMLNLGYWPDDLAHP